MNDYAIRLDESSKILGVKPKSLYGWIKRGVFPRPILLSPRTAVYMKSEIDALLSARGAGATDEQVRALVQRLVAERQLRASAQGVSHG